MEKQLVGIISEFNPGCVTDEITPCKIGLINSTYFVRCGKARYILQRINTDVFENPIAVMNNIKAVTSHLMSKGEPTVCYLDAPDGKPFIEDNGFWRMSRMVEGETRNEVNEKLLFEGARAFGRFGKCLDDFDASRLVETIPDFHNTKKRIEKLRLTVENNPFGRASQCGEILDYVFSHEKEASLIVDNLEAGKLPLRVVHNDTKINNVIFDGAGRGICVIDLDTVMPGSALFDFGDAIRSGAASVSEGSRDFGHTALKTDFFDAFLRGYIEGMQGSLSESETALLPESAFTIALELSVRFLDDFINGDKYFRTSYEDENLIRSKGQCLLARDIEKKLPELHAIVSGYTGL